MTATYEFLKKWEGGADDEGHRTYDATFQVRTDDPSDGPAVVMQCAGLPTTGATWAIGNDIDVYAWCTPYMMVKPTLDDELHCHWEVVRKFTTKPMSRCNTTQIDNPLAEPAQLSGGFTKYTEEAIYDRYGSLLLTSSYELMRGPEVEVEKGRPVVRVGLNVATLPLTTFCEYRGGVNNATLWGLPARCIRLADITWERKVYGTCSYYYTITYEFEIKFETWNRFIIDSGQYAKKNRALPLSASNPLQPLIDKETGRWQTGYLDGAGGLVAMTDGFPDPSQIYVHQKQLEKQYNFLALGIPTSL